MLKPYNQVLNVFLTNVQYALLLLCGIIYQVCTVILAKMCAHVCIDACDSSCDKCFQIGYGRGPGGTYTPSFTNHRKKNRMGWNLGILVAYGAIYWNIKLQTTTGNLCISLFTVCILWINTLITFCVVNLSNWS